MSDLVFKLISDHGIAAVLSLANIAILLWGLKWMFANQAAQNANQVSLNRDIARLLERNGMDTLPPPVGPVPVNKHIGRVFPRKATPLPFFPVPAAVPEPVDNDG